MTRETKLSILIGVSLVLVVAILISDHFSAASEAQLGSVETATSVIEPSLAVESFEKPSPSVIVQDENGRFVPLDQVAATNERSEPGQSTFSQLAENLQQEYALLRENGLTPAAETVTVPSLKMGEPALLPAAKDTTELPESTRPDRVHVVAEADTLWGIASRYYNSGLLHSDIRKYNGLSPNEALTIGMQLRIPERARLGSPAPKQAPRNTPLPKTAEGNRLYTVQSGDTLSEIAHRELGAVSRMYDIRDAQGKTIDPEDFMLRVGMTLRLPAD